MGPVITYLRWAAAPLALAAALVLTPAARAQEPDKPKDPPKPSPGATPPEEPAKPESAPAKVNPNVSEQTRVINKLLADAWTANNLKPSRRATDYEFIRRATLDVIGRIASPEEVNHFVTVDRGDRPKLIHRLLNDRDFKLKVDGKTVKIDYAEEYARHWADVWTNWLLTRGGAADYHKQMHLWLEEEFTKNASHKEFVEKLLTASGKSNDNGAVNYILAHLGELQRGRERDEGMFEAVPVTSRTTRLFLGIQTQCTQCHDHPLVPDRKQSEFWGVNAFFREVVRDGTPAMTRGNRMTQVTPLTLRDDPGNNPRGIVSYERRNGVFMDTRPVFLGDKDRKWTPTAGKPRRQLLAEFVTTHDNFGKAYVNRLWGHFFGRGLNEQASVDDFGEHNKVVHPELLEKLATDFNQYAKYDSKQLITWICTSDAYNLSCMANATNAKPETDVFFSRMQLKAMSPEQLLDSLMHATRSDSVGDKKARDELRAAWMGKLVRNFGDDEGNEITFNGTVVQALLMMNGKELNNELTRKDKSTVEVAIRKHPASMDGVIKELYLASLNRPPTPVDLAALKKHGAAYDVRYFQDLFWALLNSNEFILNH